jgi:transcription termination factor Rho
MGRRRRKRGGSSGGSANSEQQLQQLTDRLADYIPVQPDERIRLETKAEEQTGRVIDLIAPIGRGQRVLVTSPPKAGKTLMLQAISLAVHQNYPDIHQMALLVDERPEEATDFKRNLPIPVFASTTDKGPKEHIRMAENVFVEALERLYAGEDVLILLDSITRLARAYNTVHGNSSRTLSGGVTAGALDRPRQLFGVARNFEEKGSVTIIATALIDTGSRMDEVIFQEFKGTGNSEIVLDRRLAERRLWPAVDIAASGTRREDLLQDAIESEKVALMRRKLSDMGDFDRLEWLLKSIKKTRSNLELLKSNF